MAGRPPRDYAVARCVEAWHDLGTERPVGFTVGAIPWSKIIAWADFHGLDREATSVLTHVIRTLDNERAQAAAAKAALDQVRGQDEQPRARNRR